LKLTPVVRSRFVPVIATIVPKMPVVGEKPVTVGAGIGAMSSSTDWKASWFAAASTERYWSICGASGLRQDVADDARGHHEEESGASSWSEAR
jgi:hypothetical protein